MANLEIRSLREERRELGSRLRRDHVIAAASAVFAKKGFQGAQVSEIAAAAELSLASVYSMFRGKEELYEAVITTAGRRIRDVVRGHVERIGNARDQLLGLIDSLFACFQENQDLLRIYARATHGLPWKVRQALGESSVELFQDFTDWVVEIARRAQRAGLLGGLAPESVALSLIGAVMTMATYRVEREPERPLSEAAPGVRALFERVLAEPERS